jgi:hypothetical protein
LLPHVIKSTAGRRNAMLFISTGGSEDGQHDFINFTYNGKVNIKQLWDEPGMAGVRQLIESNGGEIRIIQHPNKQIDFMIRFPVTESQMNGSHPHQSQVETAA